MPDAAAWLNRLEADGLLRHEGARLRTTRRWQGAMARAALRLLAAGDRGGDDLRAPVAAALLELYGDTLDDESIAEAVVAMLPIERAELAP